MGNEKPGNACSASDLVAALVREVAPAPGVGRLAVTVHYAEAGLRMAIDAVYLDATTGGLVLRLVPMADCPSCKNTGYFGGNDCGVSCLACFRGAEVRLAERAAARASSRQMAPEGGDRCGVKDALGYPCVHKPGHLADGLPHATDSGRQWREIPDSKLLQATVARWDEGTGQWGLMNRPDRGFGELGHFYDSLDDITAAWPVRLGKAQP